MTIYDVSQQRRWLFFSFFCVYENMSKIAVVLLRKINHNLLRFMCTARQEMLVCSLWQKSALGGVK